MWGGRRTPCSSTPRCTPPPRRLFGWPHAPSARRTRPSTARLVERGGAVVPDRPAPLPPARRAGFAPGPTPPGPRVRRAPMAATERPGPGNGLFFFNDAAPPEIYPLPPPAPLPI